MQIICTSLQTPTSYHSIYRLDALSDMLFLTPNQQCQSTEGNNHDLYFDKQKWIIKHKTITHAEDITKDKISH